jgi:hypothetical protein
MAEIFFQFCLPPLAIDQKKGRPNLPKIKSIRIYIMVFTITYLPIYDSENPQISSVEIQIQLKLNSHI